MRGNCIHKMWGKGLCECKKRVGRGIYSDAQSTLYMLEVVKYKSITLHRSGILLYFQIWQHASINDVITFLGIFKQSYLAFLISLEYFLTFDVGTIILTFFGTFLNVCFPMDCNFVPLNLILDNFLS